MTEQELIEQLNILGINVTLEQKNKLKDYASFLLEYNQHTNLTAIRTIEEVYLKHFYDSLTLVKMHHFQNEKILDIGTGAGFPGMILAIIFPTTNVFLLDSNHKKIDFLNELIKKLSLNNVTTIYDRAENYVKNNREIFDIVTTRAVSELRILLELSIPALKVGGYFLGMKAKLEEELEVAKDTILILNSKIINKIEFDLPKEKGKRTILKIRKEKQTKEEYPREYRVILKKTLKNKNI